MKGNGTNQLVSSSRASWYLIQVLIFPVLKIPKEEHKTLTMADAYVSFKNAIKPSC